MFISLFLAGVDAVLLTQYADSNIKYCMAVFRGTQPELWKSGGRDDWVSNMDLRESIIQFQGQTCHVHRGYHEAYVNFEYRDEIEDYLQNCQQTCQDECDVILTGHSQGGTIAIMAAMEIMKQQQQTTSVPPFVVTLGAPQGLGTGCRGFLTELGNHYGGIHISCGWFHYIMSTTGTFGLTYDAVPMVFPHLLNGLAAYAKAKNDHGITHDEGFAFLGHELLVTTQQVDSLLYIGLDQHRFGMPYSAQAHWDWLYKEVLVDMLEATASATMSSLPTNGFAPRSMCNINEECSSHCCKRETFTWTLTCC
jgi:hypothetical protein